MLPTLTGLSGEGSVKVLTLLMLGMVESNCFIMNHMNFKYQNFVSSVGIPGYSFYVGRDSKCLKSKTLAGPEKLKVFRNIRIAELVQ